MGLRTMLTYFFSASVCLKQQQRFSASSCGSVPLQYLWLNIFSIGISWFSLPPACLLFLIGSRQPPSDHQEIRSKCLSPPLHCIILKICFRNLFNVAKEWWHGSLTWASTHRNHSDFFAMWSANVYGSNHKNWMGLKHCRVFLAWFFLFAFYVEWVTIFWGGNLKW